MHLLALADDLTGALEVGAKFAASGVRAAVTTELSLDAAAADALVIDTETRHLPPAQAGARVGDLAAEARARGVRHVYKKTDSTLRGNIACELDSLVAAFGGAALLYAPAYPQMGRTVKAGRLYVDGVPLSATGFANDALNPIRDSAVAAVLGARAASIQVCDGETDADVHAAARRAAGGALSAGPAALAEQLAALLPLPRGAPRGWPRIGRCLVVNGSRHEVSARQVACARGSLAARGWHVLSSPDPCEALPLLSGCDGVIVFGGDTAYALVEALGERQFEPFGEVLPGVPISRLRELWLITKAGGFGRPDTLCAIQERVCASE